LFPANTSLYIVSTAGGPAEVASTMARSIGSAVFVGGWALSQLWLFIVAPFVGAAVAAGIYSAIRLPDVVISTPQGERALASQQAERGK